MAAWFVEPHCWCDPAPAEVRKIFVRRADSHCVGDRHDEAVHAAALVTIGDGIDVESLEPAAGRSSPAECAVLRKRKSEAALLPARPPAMPAELAVGSQAPEGCTVGHHTADVDAVDAGVGRTLPRAVEAHFLRLARVCRARAPLEAMFTLTLKFRPRPSRQTGQPAGCWYSSGPGCARCKPTARP